MRIKRILPRPGVQIHRIANCVRKGKKLPSLVFYYIKKSAAKQVNECEKFFTPLFCTHIVVFYAKKMEFYGRRNTFSGGRIHMSIRLFAQTLLRVLPLIYAATQKNIHIRRGEQEEIFNELF